MEKNLIENLVLVCRIFDKHSVQYIVVGGAAVALHGYFRHSMEPSGLPLDKNDLDFWYDPTYDNYFRLLDALNELGQDVSRYKEEQTPDPKKSFFRIEGEHFTLDLIPELPGLSRFRHSYSQREMANFEDLDVPFLNFDDLIKSKEAMSRSKDIEDIQELKTRRNSRR